MASDEEKTELLSDYRNQPTTTSINATPSQNATPDQTGATPSQNATPDQTGATLIQNTTPSQTVAPGQNKTPDQTGATPSQNAIPSQNVASSKTHLQRALDLFHFSRELSSRRNCIIEVANSSRKVVLFHPKIFVSAGHIRLPPDATIPCGQKTILSFTKLAYRLGGTSGLVSYTYAIGQVQKRFVVFWRVPQIGTNKFGAGFTGPERKSINQDMYDKFVTGSGLPEHFETFTARTGDAVEIQSTEDAVEVTATMGDNIHAIMKIEFSDIPETNNAAMAYRQP